MTHAIYKPRSAWGARAPKGGPGQLTPSRVRGVAIHWPGSGETDSFDHDAEVAEALRGWQAFHMDGRGWSDIAYQVAVSQDGDVWSLRGLRTQSGANGDASLNEQYGAILLVLVAGELPSAAMKRSVQNVIRDFRDIYGDDAKEIRPHSAIRQGGTDCPGPLARLAIARGEFEPGTTPTTPEDDDMPLSDADKQWIDTNGQKWAKATNNFTRQTVAGATRAILTADAATDKAQADRIIADLNAKAADLSAKILADAEREGQ
jgi:hypothetical protein